MTVPATNKKASSTHKKASTTKTTITTTTTSASTNTNPRVHPTQPYHDVTREQSQSKSQSQSQHQLRFRQFGKPHACEPTDPLRAKEGVIQWSWCPTYSWMWAVWIVLVILVLVAIVIMVWGGPAGMVFGILLLIACLAVIWAIANFRWNENKQQAYQLARGKRRQALLVWEHVSKTQRFRAKDVFYSTRYGGKRLVVLRDGTIECYGTHKDDLFDYLNEDAVEEGGGGNDHDGKDENNDNPAPDNTEADEGTESHDHGGGVESGNV